MSIRYKSLPIERAVQSIYNKLRIILTLGSAGCKGEEII
jgi:hypothetical protein